jgi:hypothetical protein
LTSILSERPIRYGAGCIKGARAIIKHNLIPKTFVLALGERAEGFTRRAPM